MKREVAVLGLHSGQVNGRKSHLWNSSVQFSKVETFQRLGLGEEGGVCKLDVSKSIRFG